MIEWLASQNSGTATQDCFQGGEVTNLLFNFIENSNKEITGKEKKERVHGDIRRNTIRGGGTCKKPWDSLCMNIEIIFYVYSMYEFEPVAKLSIYIQLHQGFEG